MRRILTAGLILLPLFLSAGDRIENDGTETERTFYRDENKFIDVRRDSGSWYELKLFRINRPSDFLQEKRAPGETAGYGSRIDSSQPAVGDFLTKYFSGFEPMETRKYGIEPQLVLTLSPGNGDGRIFIPLKQIGLFLAEETCAGKRQTRLLNVSDLALVVKRDHHGTLVYSLNRRTGTIIRNVSITGEGLEGRQGQKTRLKTDLDGMLSLSQIAFQQYGLLIGSWSNSFAIVHAETVSSRTNDLYKPISLPERRCYDTGETINVYSMFFKKDIFKDYQAETEGFFLMGFADGRMDRYPIQAPVTKTSLTIPLGMPGGTYQLLTVYGERTWTNKLYIMEPGKKDVLIDIEPDRPFFIRGQKVVGDIRVSNLGLRRIGQALTSWCAYCLDRESGTLLDMVPVRPFSCAGSRRFSISTRQFPARNAVVIVEVLVRTGDGKTTHAFREIPVESAEKSIGITAETRILRAGDGVSIDVRSDDIRNPTAVKRLVLQVISASGARERVVQSHGFETRSRETNLMVYPSGTGRMIVKVRDRKDAAVSDEAEIWVVPDMGDMKADLNKHDFLIISDKPGYAFGDIAKILVISRRKGINGLMTFEGDEIYLKQHLEFNNNFLLLDIPIIEPNKPNSELIVQTVISNRPVYGTLNIPVPYRNKEIMYDLASFQERNEAFRFETDNIWGRTIKTFSIISFGNRNAFLDWNRDNYGKYLYPGKKPAVITYSGCSPQEPDAAPPSAPFFLPWREKDLLEPEDRENCMVSEDVSTNILKVDDQGELNSHYLTCNVRSLSVDGKTGRIQRVFQSGEPLEIRTLVPGYLRSKDRSDLVVSLRNPAEHRQWVKVRAEFFNGNMMFIRTNSARVEGGGRIRYRIRIPQEALDGTENLSLSLEYRTAESRRRTAYEISVEQSGQKDKDETGFQEVRSYRKMVFFPGGKSVPVLPGTVFNAEDIVLVTVRLAGTDTGKLLEPLPSGFSLEETGIAGEDRPESETKGYAVFPLDRTARRNMVRYYLRARIPGVYSVPAGHLVLPDGTGIRARARGGSETRLKVVF